MDMAVDEGEPMVILAEGMLDVATEGEEDTLMVEEAAEAGARLMVEEEEDMVTVGEAAGVWGKLMVVEEWVV